LDQAAVDVSARVLPSLVRVEAGRRGNGSGVVWTADGLIVTNAHVARGDTLTVTLRDGRRIAARLVARDDRLDLAALRVDLTDLPAAVLDRSDALRPGELVLAYGHPWGVADGATVGVVISVGPGIADIGLTDRRWIKASLHLRPGHSGGPMVDALGRLVGINTIMNGPEVGVAIPVDVVREFLGERLSA
jgi:serine protease Do